MIQRAVASSSSSVPSSSSLVPPFVVDMALTWRARLCGTKGQAVGLLIGRLAVGLLFVSTGWGKVHSIPKVTQFFVDLGIPLPGFNAVLVGWSELVCGGLLVLGLATRLATVPLAMSMMVALVTAKRAEIHGVFSLVGQDELTYLALMVVLAVVGPGALSLDRLFLHKVAPQAIERSGT